MDLLFEDLVLFDRSAKKNYYVNSLGEVFSYRLSNQKWKKIKPRKCTNGYYAVSINGKYPLIHRIVAKAFLENPENKPCVNHKNSIISDNSLENLEWCTYSENTLHSWGKGRMEGNRKITKNIAGKVGKSRRNMSFEDATEVRRLYKNGGILQKDLAEQFNVSREVITGIINNYSYIEK
ncbi:HNH endonuclease [Staphylococcus capitis]|uniref:HNH endonuclease n=1 Tax=Staphylococcus capitis TaxID=29388 RepID=UPI00024E2077|nr:HNH endonuclease [Staphylococcus capitis]EHR93269.1 hypothetical protein SEVCU123_1227 [Staphylococcus epidermidis VCU123]MBM6017170.1 HNH endonuclease [Staphylococcus epidermidis]MCT2012947.1 HNH endonuclease [Staphylococcus capitis]MDU7264552.1 HNH endonuclease [Staphylococcus epidermidis]